MRNGDVRVHDGRILVLPFIEPNDWDARRVGGMDAEAMLRAWQQRLDIVRRRGEPCFIIDVHQWLVTEPDNLRVLAEFLVRYSG